MPFPFVLPTTSAFSFSSSFASDTHPSLPLTASTFRGVLRDALKKHKRLPPTSQSSHISTVISALQGYIPYLLAVDAGLGDKVQNGEIVSVILKETPSIEWRPTLSDWTIPGRDNARIKVQSLEYEISFVLGTLASAYVLDARTALRPLYVTSTASVGTEERLKAIRAASQHVFSAAAIYDYLVGRAEHVPTHPPCADVAASTLRGLSSLALAEANLLSVLKDDPYPAIVAQDRNENDKEWMYKAPEVSKVRAQIFARVCLAAAEHAAKASALCQSTSGKGGGNISKELVRYMEDVRRTARARACRFFGLEAEGRGELGVAIGYLDAGLHELGVEKKEEKKHRLGFGRLKKEWNERREDKKVDKESGWGADGGKMEETRVIEMLEAQWNKINDTMNTKVVPPFGPLLAQLPSGRDFWQNRVTYEAPILEKHILEPMRAPPDREDDYENAVSSDDEPGRPGMPIGAYPVGKPPGHGTVGGYF